MTDRTWHDWYPLLIDAVNAVTAAPSAANKKELRERISTALRPKNVVRDKSWLIDTNEHGRSYSCMNQSEMGVALLRAGVVLGQDNYIEQGMAALQVLLADYDDGGLRTRSGGGSWFHGMTSRSNKQPGGTLNKHLSAARWLQDAAQLVGPYSQSKQRAYRMAGEEGLRQLAAKKFPSLDHFIVKVNGQPRADSWAYYAVTWGSREGRFLDHPTKNASYHLFCMRLIEELFNGVGVPIDRTEFRSNAKTGRSSLRRMLDSYEAKLAAGGLDVDSPAAPGGNFTAVTPGTEPLVPRVIELFKTL